MLFTHTVLHLTHLLSRGDYKALANMGLDETQAERLLDIHATDLNNLSTVLSQCVTIRIDGECFNNALDYLAQQRQQRSVVVALIKAEAPFALVRDLYGVDSMEYSGLRRCYTKNSKTGRPKNLSEDEEQRLWTAWIAIINEQGNQSLLGEDYLAIYKRSGQIPLKHAWPVLNRFRSDADLQQRQQAQSS